MEMELRPIMIRILAIKHTKGGTEPSYYNKGPRSTSEPKIP